MATPNSKKDIKSGSNSNGSWIKYPDGTLICSSSQIICEASKPYREATFPIQFREVNALTITNRYLNDPDIIWSYDSLKISGFRAYPRRNLATPSIATSFSYIAIGKWA